MPDKDGYLKTAFYNSINTPSILKNNLTNSHIVLVTAHPDDESMFFTPTITELTKDNYNNTIHLVCLSNGGYNGLGDIREQELLKAARILSIGTVRVLDYEDDITAYWDTSDIIESIDAEVNSIIEAYGVSDRKQLILLSFDSNGVSNHPNHKSVHVAVKSYSQEYKIRSYSLKSWNVLVKYSGVLATNLELAIKWVFECHCCKHLLNYLDADFANYLDTGETSKSIKIYSDLNSIFLNLTTMTWAHYSQIVWFRWIWIFSSKYMNSNEIVPIS